MFSVCTSVEYDLRSFILNSSLQTIPKELVSKAVKRDTKIDINNPHHIEKILQMLDLGDLVEIIVSSPYDFKINNDKSRLLISYFSKVIPIRNRVMHTRPLELGDRATLTEVLETINHKISWITWKETITTKQLIKENPSKLMARDYIKIIDIEPNVYHNLPEPEFDDTGYIGRKEEVKEIKKLLKDNKNQIITIVGNGGIGKTATAVKTLYDLIDDPENRFEAIIWISLKTRTLSAGEFINIKDAIYDISSLYRFGESIVIKEKDSPKDNILNFMNAFCTLLVIDNFETIGNNEIISFIKSIPEKSKVLITSRNGLGELENRYTLNGLKQNDAIIYFRELSKYYGLTLHTRSNEEIKKTVVHKLYSSPLSIKWFLSSIYSGIDEKTILNSKEDLVEFCMSNVVDKLNDKEKAILQLFLIEGKKLSYGEIDYFMDASENDLVKFINNLTATSMLMYTTKGNFELNQMAKDFMSIFHKPSMPFFKEVLAKRKKLNAILQDVRVKNENDPFNPKSLFRNLESDNKMLASYYLMKALEVSSTHDWKKAFDFIQRAANIAPDYFEVYKIKAFISAENGDLFEAMTCYRTAIENCSTNFEKATVLYLFSIFNTLKMDDLETAKDLINEADSIYPNEPMIKIEKGRVLTYLGQFEPAESLLLSVQNEYSEQFTSKQMNQLISRLAELYRRMGENYEMRDSDKKLELYKKSIYIIETLEDIDSKTYALMAKTLLSISFLFFSNEAMEFLLVTIKHHFNALNSLRGNSIGKMKNILESHPYEIPNELLVLVKSLNMDFAKLAKRITSEHEGIIVRIKDYYGFIHNASQSLYFRLPQLQYSNPSIGDHVSFLFSSSPKGNTAYKIKLIEKYNPFYVDK
jgi:tetratricopeptide (TPR) repeat protein